MLKFRSIRSRNQSNPAPTTAATTTAATTAGTAMTRDANHPLRIRNLLDHPELRSVMDRTSSPEPVAPAASSPPVRRTLFNRRHLLEGAA